MKNQPISQHSSSDKVPEINKFFTATIKSGGSDLHMKADCIPRIRSKGALRNTTSGLVSEEKMEEMVFEILSENQKKFFLEQGALDFAYDFGDTDRFRVNIFRQRGKISLVARRVSAVIPDFSTLNLPTIIQDISDYHQGLILVTGVTGSGKSTTIASMIDRIIKQRPCHVVTVEDPIEYIYTDAKGLVNQREVGIDCVSFEDALRSLMREDPDVALVGEIRDFVTLNAAIKAAETGHQVFGTLHSTDTYQSITRMLDLTPEVERYMVRQALVGNLRAIISQRLLPTIRKEVPRVPALEILIVNAVVRKLIADEREVDIPSVIKSHYADGMVDFNESLRRLVVEEMIDMKIAYNYSTNIDELKMAMKGIKNTASTLIG